VTLQSWLLVFLGGGAGSLLRVAMSQFIGNWGHQGFPLGTLCVNVAGSLVMGLLAAMLPFATDGGAGSSRILLMAGVLGGFTTFSAFSLETMQLIERGAMATALLYVALSVVVSLGALAAGLAIGRSL
jgi:fluoride exporter